jgi:hypothetical protein
MQGGAQGQAPAGNGQQGGQQGFSWRGVIVQLLVMYFIFSYLFGGNKQATVDPSTGKALQPHRPLWHGGERMQLLVFQSENEEMTPEEFKDPGSLLWSEDQLFYDWRPENERIREVVIKTTPGMMNNGSLWAHIYLIKGDHSPDPASEHYKKSALLYKRQRLNTYLPKPKLKGRKNLISGEMEDDPEMLALQKAKESVELVSFWKPNLTLNMVHDFTVYPRGGIPPQMEELMSFDAEGSYHPTLFINEFWIFREHLYPINETTPELPLRLEYNTLSMWKWQMMVQMQHSFKMQESWGSAAEGESDEIKRMLVETNPWLLVLTFAVSILHSVFDFLAFKNDISFWKEKKNLEGLSVRTIFVNCITQFIILLYLFDNDTSWIILISASVGLLIEAWKITKAVEVIVQWPNGGLPSISFKDRATYSARTKELDVAAMKYLSYLLYVLVVGYAIYSLAYDTHKSWYSWILNSLTGCIYTFGFVMMTPQLFINYKLKSVAHMPWKTFVYKALNTFVDDLFAFIIRMPTLHRVACFRDDIIFFIFLYQRWIYPVDKTRVNEFGQSGEDGEPASVDANASAAALPAAGSPTAVVDTKKNN